MIRKKNHPISGRFLLREIGDLDQFNSAGIAKFRSINEYQPRQRFSFAGFTA
jgi:hypothetical protein